MAAPVRALAGVARAVSRQARAATPQLRARTAANKAIASWRPVAACRSGASWHAEPAAQPAPEPLQTAAAEEEARRKREKDRQCTDLAVVLSTLRSELPSFFEAPLDFGLYCDGIVLRNNIGGWSVRGLRRYKCVVRAFKATVRCTVLNPRLEVLNMYKCAERHSIRVRWRVCGRSVVAPWRDKAQLDLFSEFYVNRRTGRISMHVLDRMVPSEEPFFARRVADDGVFGAVL